MGKNSNAHKRSTFHDADLQREREEDAKRGAKREKMLQKRMKQVLAPAEPAAAKATAAPMDVDGSKHRSKQQPLRTQLSGISKKPKGKRVSPMLKRQLIRAAKGKEMQL